MTLWDAMAAAVSELELGSVLEVIAKPRPGYRNEVTCMALRPSTQAEPGHHCGDKKTAAIRDDEDSAGGQGASHRSRP